MSDRRVSRCAGALAVVVAASLPVLVAAPAPVTSGTVAGAGTPAAVPAAPVPSGAGADPGAAALPTTTTPVEQASLDVADLPGAGRELLAAMIGPGAVPGEAETDLVGLPPGTVPVAREGEAGLELSWALVDTASDRWTGSANAATDRTEAESTIKAWLAADTLRAAAEAGRPVTDAERGAISAAVRTSDDDAAERLYRALGRDASTARLDDECGVEVSTSRPGWWSFTQITAVDAARILACVRDRAPEWPGGAELLTDLASISPDGRSGIHTGLPGDVVEKNGWTLHGRGTWNVNCVLVWEQRALAVLLTFPADRGVEYGWAVCRDVADDVLAAG